MGTCGSVQWAPPEALDERRKNERTEKGDVFAFGVIVWELVTRKIPWADEGYTLVDIAILVTSGERLEIPQDCPLKSLIESCWKNGNN